MPTAADLEREERTLLLTLRMHALDAALPAPVLGDHAAALVLDRLDDRRRVTPAVLAAAPLVVARARAIDERVQAWVRAHLDGLVVHLACGLDDRARRIVRPPGLRWIDLDQPRVVALRREVVDARDGVELQAGDATDPDLWAGLDPDRDVLAVGEGLLMYLEPDDVAALVDGIARRPAATRLVADVVSPAVRRGSALSPALRAAGTRFASDEADLDRVLGAHPRLDLIERTPLGAELLRGVVPGPAGRIAGALASLGPMGGASLLRTVATGAG